jgi:hypothetical protein
VERACSFRDSQRDNMEDLTARLNVIDERLHTLLERL